MEENVFTSKSTNFIANLNFKNDQRNIGKSIGSLKSHYDT